MQLRPAPAARRGVSVETRPQIAVRKIATGGITVVVHRRSPVRISVRRRTYTQHQRQSYPPVVRTFFWRHCNSILVFSCFLFII